MPNENECQKLVVSRCLDSLVHPSSPTRHPQAKRLTNRQPVDDHPLRSWPARRYLLVTRPVARGSPRSASLASTRGRSPVNVLAADSASARTPPAMPAPHHLDHGAVGRIEPR
jgi:hypothetical protein